MCDNHEFFEPTEETRLKIRGRGKFWDSIFGGFIGAKSKVELNIKLEGVLYNNVS